MAIVDEPVEHTIILWICICKSFEVQKEKKYCCAHEHDAWPRDRHSKEVWTFVSDTIIAHIKKSKYVFERGVSKIIDSALLNWVSITWNTKKYIHSGQSHSSGT